MKKEVRNTTAKNDVIIKKNATVSNVIYDDGDKDRTQFLSPLYYQNGDFFSDPHSLRIIITECDGECTCRLDNQEKNIRQIIDFKFNSPEDIIGNAEEMFDAGLDYAAAYQTAIIIASDMITDLAERARAFRSALKSLADSIDELSKQ